jgi:sugar O-acyltransferase (sialic acid O-acetyltransferase NeuD family)
VAQVQARLEADVPNLVIFGAGEAARLATRYFEEQGRYRIAGYTVDIALSAGDNFQGRELVAFGEALLVRFPPSQVEMFVALGFLQMNGARAAKFAAIKALGYTCASYLHPSNRLPPETAVGENCFILANQSVDRDVSIGDNVTIWSGCHLGDRSRIADHAWLSSEVCISGDVVVGERCFLASNCTISPGVTVAERCLIGANALIVRNTDPDAVHVVQGTPAQPMDSLRFMAMLRMT